MTIPNIATFDHGTYYFGKTLENLTFAQLLGFVFWKIFYGLSWAKSPSNYDLGEHVLDHFPSIQQANPSLSL